MKERDRAFGDLFDAHFADLWRFARRRCPNAEDADDVAAETFAVAWRRREDVPAGDDARLWLFGVARGVLANSRRSAGRRDRLRRRSETLAPVTAAPPDPADVVAERDADLLLAALASLAEDDRELLVLRAWDGLAVTEMAALLDLTPNAVSVRLSRARTRLAGALGRTDQGPSRTGCGRSPSTGGGAP